MKRPLARPCLAALLCAAAFLRAEAAVDFNLEPADVPKIVVLVFKPNRIAIELTVTKAKQDELQRLAAAPQSVRILLSGNPVAERDFKAPPKGNGMKFELNTLDEAFTMIRTLDGEASAAEKNPAGITPETDASIVDLQAGDITRAILYMFRPSRTYLEVACTPEKREELIFLAGHQPAQPLLVGINGNIVAQRSPDSNIKAGYLRMDMGSPSAAFASMRMLCPPSTTR